MRLRVRFDIGQPPYARDMAKGVTTIVTPLPV